MDEEAGLWHAGREELQYELSKIQHELSKTKQYLDDYRRRWQENRDYLEAVLAERDRYKMMLIAHRLLEDDPPPLTIDDFVRRMNSNG